MKIVLIGFVAAVLAGCSGLADPPPTSAECDAISGDAYTCNVCAKLQDPIVWRQGHPAVPFPPNPDAASHYYHSTEVK
jgi:hypothetical protein